MDLGPRPLPRDGGGQVGGRRGRQRGSRGLARGCGGRHRQSRPTAAGDPGRIGPEGAIDLTRVGKDRILFLFIYFLCGELRRICV
jgi:hypothetical protein